MAPLPHYGGYCNDNTCAQFFMTALHLAMIAEPTLVLRPLPGTTLHSFSLTAMQ